MGFRLGCLASGEATPSLPLPPLPSPAWSRASAASPDLAWGHASLHLSLAGSGSAASPSKRAALEEVSPVEEISLSQLNSVGLDGNSLPARCVSESRLAGKELFPRARSGLH